MIVLLMTLLTLVESGEWVYTRVTFYIQAMVILGGRRGEQERHMA